jgi:hypothetical protein
MKFSAMQSSTQVSSRYARQALLIIAFLSPVFADIGCQHIGPGTIEVDRLAYNKAVVTSWEQQALLNIVRARYDDLVGFVNVDSMVQTHTQQGAVSATLGALLTPWNIVTSTLSPSLAGSRTTTDSPLISYTPLAGSEFTRTLTAPIKPVDICNLIESGYAADGFLNLTVYSINEITSRPPEVTLSSFEQTSPGFSKLTRAIKFAYRARDLNFYVQPGTDTDEAKVFMIISDKDRKLGTGDLPYPVAFIREKLHLNAAGNKFEIVEGSYPIKENEIAIRTRSTIAAIRWLSNYVDVPDAHIEAFGIQKNRPAERYPALKVEATVNKPKPRDTFAAIKYQGYWFSIPRNDHNSKFSLIYLRTLLALADTSAKPSPPVLTIPTR